MPTVLMRLYKTTAPPELAQLNKGKNMEFTFKVTEQEANAILAGLQELPARVANPLSQKLQQQAQEQLPKQEPQE
jgi:predicted DNA-binding transcriptional regulator YafY